MTPPVAKCVRRSIAQHALIARGERVAIALSGGSDSVALTLLLNDLAARGALAMAGVIHVNHQMRGDESLRDEMFCRALATRLALPIDVVHVDVTAAMRESRTSVEAAARGLRYRALTDAASRLGATRVATGHTLDDQAETVLMRLLRGAGHRGVGGIRARRGMFIRPLLECRRQDLRAFVSGRGEFFCEDSSNQNDAIARNRLRHMLMPVIERLAPRGAAALARFAALATADEQYLQHAANAASATVVQSAEAGVKVNRAALRALPSALSRRVVRRALEQVAGEQFSARHIGAVVDLAAAEKTGGHLDVPGLSIDVDAATLHVAPTTRTGGAFARSKKDDAKTETERPLAVPGSVHLEDGTVMTAVVRCGASMPAVPSGRGLEATVRAEVIALPMSVRQRRPGDRLRPFGAPGRRKLQDVLVDRKVPRIARDRVPIVVDAADRIVWVVGVTIAHECRVTEPGAPVVILKVERKLDS